ncbi:ketoacyl-ACP synthase III family protein [Streptomyces sp. NPDC050504]|uniref:ketoacyl-ACP synthase III family protein n=1 Tax=Streptomyces sp. NPDC050504 TaxID=3365618 RepID=UPI0037AFC3E9
MKLSNIHVQSIGLYRSTESMSPAEAGLHEEEFPGGDLKSVQIAPGVPPVDMAVSAAREAIGRTGTSAAETGILLHATCFWNGPEEWSPAGYIMRELGCPDTSGQILNQGCNGMLAALEMAAGWLALREEGASALLTTATMVDGSTTIDRWRSAGYGIAIGDGACALVLGRRPGIAEVSAVNSTTVPEMEWFHRGALPLTEPNPPLRPKVDVLARARENTALSAQTGLELQSLQIQAYRKVMRRTLDDVGIEPEDLTKVLFANVGGAQTDATIMQQLRLPLSRSTWDYGRTIGHVGASDHVYALEHLITTGEVSRGDRLMLVCGTAGFHISCIVLTVGDLSPYEGYERHEQEALRR